MPRTQDRPTSRRSFLAGAAAATGALGGGLRSEAQSLPRQSAAPRRPLNVLFLMSDDMRPELGCYGSRFDAQTPHIDRLAAQGVRFDRNYCQFPLCNPSRSSMFTGRPPHTTGVLGNGVGVTQLHPDWTTLPRLFRNAGYTTLRTGKLFHAGFDDREAWTVFDGETETLHPAAVARKEDIPRIQIPMPDGQLPVLPQDNARAAHSDELLILPGDGAGSGDAIVANRTISNLRAMKAAGKPFFIGCGFSKPHSPPEAPQSFYDLYDPAKIELPPDFAAWPTVPPSFPPAAIRMRNADLFIGRGASEREAKLTIQAYLASISWVDHNVGRVLAELDALGLRDDTVVVFVVDHGYQLGEKGKWSKAGSLFEQGTRVPLIIHAPGMAGNGRSSYRITESLHVYRTLTELCGLTPPNGVEGKSMVPLLANPAAPWDHPAFSVWSEDGKTIHGTMVRTENWRYAEFGQAGRNGAMLFNVHADPMELTNLAEDSKHADTRAGLSALIAGYGSHDLQEPTG